MIATDPILRDQDGAQSGPTVLPLEDPKPAALPTLVSIASAGHSGSTLLDLLLGNHPDVCSAGEMNRLTLHSSERVCACGATVRECEYWTAVRGAMTRHKRLQTMIEWHECHTDIPPQTPILRLEGASTASFADGGRPSSELRQRLADAGVRVSDAATLSRSGVRDFKWRLVDPAAEQTHVLRSVGNAIDVYDTAVTWKNPVRLIPEPIELALAVGMRSAVKAARRCSRAANRYVEIAENSWAVAEAMASVSRARFIIDSSKSPLRMKLMYMLCPERVRILHLVRDGRAVGASAMRRQKVTAAMAARIWKRENQNLETMLRSVPAHSKLAVRYEAICDDPAREVKRICGFLGLAFRSDMLAWWTRPVHNIPGNPMLFNRTQRAIAKDERWRRELSEQDVAAFERVAGRFNRSRGYE